MSLGTIHSVARIGLVVIFAYHGLVPKLLTRHADELLLLRRAGIAEDQLVQTVTVVGVLELLFALLLLFFWRHRFPAIIALLVMIAALFSSVVLVPDLATAAFNPVSLNIATACLAAIDVVALSMLREQK